LTTGAADGQPSGIGRRRAAAQGEGRTAYRERRQEIIAAAAGLFKTHGFRGTSIGQIAEALGTDRATLYYYIGSKEELFDEVVSDEARANVARVQAIRDGEGAAPDKLRRLVTELMDSYARSYPFLYVFVQEDLTQVSERRGEWSQEMRALNAAYEDCVVAIIEAGVAEGTIRPVAEPWVLAYGLIGMVGWTNRWFNPEESEVDAATIGRAYADVLLDGLRADR
jgi:AcrR family transcriptional regulator